MDYKKYEPNYFNKKFFKASLSNIPNYNTKISIQNTQINVSCGYNTRNKLRWIILFDSYGNVLLPQTFLKLGKRCELNYNANQNNLNYYVTLKPKNSSLKKTSPDASYDYLNWSNDFELFFSGREQVKEDILLVRGRILKVGQ